MTRNKLRISNCICRLRLLCFSQGGDHVLQGGRGVKVSWSPMTWFSYKKGNRGNVFSYGGCREGGQGDKSHELLTLKKSSKGNRRLKLTSTNHIELFIIRWIAQCMQVDAGGRRRLRSRCSTMTCSRGSGSRTPRRR